ncbi:MAG: hypothetical protein NTV62_02155 [Candidatus Gribaldobacteria bacterium]|nr:hypothetical protein [Candidatus Gribaldobacteria bacterium]
MREVFLLKRVVVTATIFVFSGAFVLGFFAKTAFDACRTGGNMVWPLALAFFGMSAAIVSSFALFSIWKWKRVRKNEIKTAILMSVVLILSFFICRFFEGRG